jgi:hypothetical protein
MSASSTLNQASTASTELHKKLEAHEDHKCGFEALQHKKYIKNPINYLLSRKSRTAMEDHSSMVLSKPSTLILSMS